MPNMQVTTRTVELTKRFPLTISRGTFFGSTNLVVEIAWDGLIGLGEYAPGSSGPPDAADGAAQVKAWADAVDRQSLGGDALRLDALLDLAMELGTDRGPLAAIDLALHDLLGQRASMPLWRVLGLDPARVPATSVTLGIVAPVVARERVVDWLNRYEPFAIKVKLGQPAGLDADRDLFAATQEAATVHALTHGNLPVRWRVDANGGWTPGDATESMIHWLAARGVEYVEQPFAAGQEDALPSLLANSPLPIYLDESVHTAADVVRFADRCHGVNLKLMKTGGIREAVRAVHTARAHGRSLMLGCMGESSLSITAGAHLSPLMDHVDLDSHLNLTIDPFVGASYVHGRVVPGDDPGLGVKVRPPGSTLGAAPVHAGGDEP